MTLNLKMSGLIGLKKQLQKIILSITITNILVIFKKLVLESLEKSIMRIGKILRHLALKSFFEIVNDVLNHNVMIFLHIYTMYPLLNLLEKFYFMVLKA